jgi:hypothetical protein
VSGRARRLRPSGADSPNGRAAFPNAVGYGAWVALRTGCPHGAPRPAGRAGSHGLHGEAVAGQARPPRDRGSVPHRRYVTVPVRAVERPGGRSAPPRARAAAVPVRRARSAPSGPQVVAPSPSARLPLPAPGYGCVPGGSHDRVRRPPNSRRLLLSRRATKCPASQVRPPIRCGRTRQRRAPPRR